MHRYLGVRFVVTVAGAISSRGALPGCLRRIIQRAGLLYWFACLF